jgi:hypothetical protein
MGCLDGGKERDDLLPSDQRVGLAAKEAMRGRSAKIVFIR